MASFQAKIGWKMLRKREYKKYRSVSFIPDAKSKIKKKQSKNSKIQKIPLWLQFKPKQVGKGCEREKKKSSLRFVPTRRVIENSKKIAKKFKKLNNTIIASFQAKIGWKTQRKREN